MRQKWLLRILRVFPICFLVFNLYSCATSSPVNSGGSAQAVGDSLSFNLYSRTVNDYYQISIDLPQDYSSNTNTSYNAVYLLDANWNFTWVRDWIRDQAAAGVMKPVILVGICPIESLASGYTGTSYSRCRDLTPTTYDTQNFPGSGGASNFIRFIEQELFSGP